MALIFRIFLVMAGAIAALFVAKDSLNFGIMQTLIAIALIVAALIVVAIWPRRQRS